MFRQRQSNKKRWGNETPECRAERLARLQECNRHENESSQAREVRLSHKQQYNKRTRESESSKSKQQQNLVTKFHKLVA